MPYGHAFLRPSLISLRRDDPLLGFQDHNCRSRSTPPSRRSFPKPICEITAKIMFISGIVLNLCFLLLTIIVSTNLKKGESTFYAVSGGLSWLQDIYTLMQGNPLFHMTFNKKTYIVCYNDVNTFLNLVNVKGAPLWVGEWKIQKKGRTSFTWWSCPQRKWWKTPTMSMR